MPSDPNTLLASDTNISQPAPNLFSQSNKKLFLPAQKQVHHAEETLYCLYSIFQSDMLPSPSPYVSESFESTELPGAPPPLSTDHSTPGIFFTQKSMK